MKKINENGRSMIEMLGVLAIIGVLSAGGLQGYSKAMFRHRLNTTMDQITLLVTNIRTMYGAQADYSGLPSDAVSLNLVPPEMGSGKVDSGSATLTLQSPFKGDVKLQLSSVKGSNGEDASVNNTAFVITYSDIPQEACVALATAQFGAGAGTGYIGAQVVGEDGKTSADYLAVGSGTGGSGTSARGEAIPYLVADALKACKGTASKNDKSAVSLKFY